MRQRVQPHIPVGYMGHTIWCTHTTLPLETIVNDSLSVPAIAMRRSLADANDHVFRSFFHTLKNEEDKTKISYGVKMNPETDIMITSFVAQKLYERSFGDILGLPAFIRRPMLPDAPGVSPKLSLSLNILSATDKLKLLYMMPATRDGDIDLIAGMSDAEFNGLMKE